ncbi:MAG: SIS domain-containing protein [Patescibacteria group bacterium]|nr:SIS domain-containing protein [Patescibacteria group bacterium]MBU1870734.1 SIS domain-containing protein [Patescibacteria group bacterium]
MINLNNQTIYKKTSNELIAKSIELLADQIRQVLEEAYLIKIPHNYSKINQIVVNGMGGSNLGAGIIKAVFNNQMKVPFSITPGYDVPASVDKNTLYLLSSYSGNTEEVLSVYQKVKEQGAKLLAITSNTKDNKLAKLMFKDNIPGYIFKSEFNPSNQPRLGLGYMIFGTAVLLAKIGLFELNIGELEDIIASLEIWDRKLRPLVDEKNNVAKQIALKLYNKQPIIIATEFLVGNARVLRNQLCENSKNFASYLVLPDLNHYAMEGLTNPLKNSQNLVFLFFYSQFFHQRIQKRIKLTKQIIEKNKITVVDHVLQGQNKLKQVFEMLQIGTWVSYYLGALNQVDPIEIPWVDWFKKGMK